MEREPSAQSPFQILNSINTIAVKKPKNHLHYYCLPLYPLICTVEYGCRNVAKIKISYMFLFLLYILYLCYIYDRFILYLYVYHMCFTFIYISFSILFEFKYVWWCFYFIVYKKLIILKNIYFDNSKFFEYVLVIRNFLYENSYYIIYTHYSAGKISLSIYMQDSTRLAGGMYFKFHVHASI